MIGFYNYTVLLTYISIGSSVLGMTYALTGNIKIAILCLMFSGFCDMFDGKIARYKDTRTDQEKNFGIQIDSLSDIICFGMYPAIINCEISNNSNFSIIVSIIFVIAAVIRLGYFNVVEQERQLITTECRKYFQGLPVTMSAFFLPIIYLLNYFNWYFHSIIFNIFMLIIAIFYLLNIKVVKFKLKGNIVMILISLIVILGIIKS